MNRWIRFYVILLGICFTCFGALAYQQNPSEDSITSLISTQNIGGKNRIEALIELARIKKSKNYAEAKIIAEKAVDEAAVLKVKQLTGKAYMVMAEIEEEHNNIDSAIAHYNFAIRFFNPQTDKFLLAKSYNERGIAYENKGLYTKAYESYIRSLRLFDELNDQKGICNEYLNIGLIHQYKKEFASAERYFNQALLIARRINYRTGQASGLNNLGINFKQQKDFSKAYRYFLQVLTMDMQDGDQANIASSLNNLGTVNSDMGKYALALAYYEKSLSIKKKLGDAVGLANTYNNVGVSLLRLKRVNESEAAFKEALSLCNRYGLHNTVVETYQGLSELESLRKNHKQALEYYLKYDEIRDSIDNSESSLTIRDLEAEYQLDKAQAEIDRQQTEIQNASTSRVLYLVIISLLLIISLYFFYSIRHTQKLYTILNKRNEELELAKENAEQATNAKTQFLSVMSHEIRTPLNAIIGIANLLDEDLTNEPHRKNISVLRIASQNLLHLINDLLDLNKLEVGKMEVDHTQLNIRKLVDSIKGMFGVSATQKGIDLLLEFDYSIPSALIGDETKLNQAITNLVSNAIKFTRNGYVKINVSLVESKVDASTILFSVSDTGIGIPADKQQTIFESFAQASTDTNRKYGGTGLGLSISKKLVEVMGGKLQVRSEKHKGSEFSFSLTFRHDYLPNVQAEKKEQVENVLFKGKRILIADDNAVNIFVLKQFLTKWGVDVVEAENGWIALQKMQEESFDLVLMDVQMPVKDGIEATIDIRNSGKPWSVIPIIAITASHESEVRIKIKECGMNDFIIKPFIPADLVEKLSKYL